MCKFLPEAGIWSDTARNFPFETENAKINYRKFEFMNDYVSIHNTVLVQNWVFTS